MSSRHKPEPVLAWTDYPFTELGDEPGKEAPIREVEVLDYDGDKYCTVLTGGGLVAEVKAGYLYTERGRSGEANVFPRELLPRKAHTYAPVGYRTVDGEDPYALGWNHALDAVYHGVATPRPPKNHTSEAKAVDLTFDELRALAVIVTDHARVHGEDVIGSIMRTSGHTILDDEGVVRLARKIQGERVRRNEHE